MSAQAAMLEPVGRRFRCKNKASECVIQSSCGKVSKAFRKLRWPWSEILDQKNGLAARGNKIVFSDLVLD